MLTLPLKFTISHKKYSLCHSVSNVGPVKNTARQPTFWFKIFTMEFYGKTVMNCINHGGGYIYLVNFSRSHAELFTHWKCSVSVFVRLNFSDSLFACMMITD